MMADERQMENDIDIPYHFRISKIIDMCQRTVILKYHLALGGVVFKRNRRAECAKYY